MSDHFSGPRAVAGPPCDIGDFYAFPSPDRPGNLVLVMDVHPLANRTTTFSDGIVYRFRTRPVTVGPDGSGRLFQTGAEELTVDVTFDAAQPDVDGGFRQTGTCRASTGASVTFVVDEAAGSAADGIRAFAGLRSDPFFLDFQAMQRSLVSGRLEFTDPGTPTAPGSNILSIVVELEPRVVAASGVGSLVATVAETLTRGKLEIRLERVGRPEVKNFLMAVKQHDRVNRDMELRDLYNLEDPFHVGPDYRNAYRSRFDANLAFFDGLDGETGWPLGADDAHPLTGMWLDDFLVLDLTRPLAEVSYLEIEEAVLAGRPHATCGGRWLNDDIMDRTYTLVIGGLGAPTISDGIDQATQRSTTRFPYLAPPNEGAAVARPLGATSAPPAGAEEAAVGARHHHESHDHAPHDHEHHTFGHYQL
jgi:hypothetical protein